MLALSIGFYVFVYTMWLKRRTRQNIVIGGAAGAFPPVIGWAAVTGNITLEPIILFAIIFFWTPPHFWALSLFAHADYERVGVPMLPVTHGAKETRQAGPDLHPGAAAADAAALTLLGFAGWVYAARRRCCWAPSSSATPSLVFRDRQDEAGRSLTGDAPARKAFRYSLCYLGLLFIALAVDRMILDDPGRDGPA